MKNICYRKKNKGTILVFTLSLYFFSQTQCQDFFNKYVGNNSINSFLSFDSINSYVSGNVNNEIWLKSIDINNDDYVGYFNRAISKLDQGYIKEAIDDLDKVILLDSLNSQAYGLRGYCRLSLSLFDSAFKDMNAAIILDSSNYFAWFGRGKINFTYGKIQEAKTDLLKSHEMFDQIPETYYYLGLISLQEDNIKKATKYLKTAVKLQADFVEPYITLSTIYALSGNAPLAMKTLKKAIQNNPDNPLPLFIRGFIYLLIGNNKDALEDLNKSVSLDQNNFFALFLRGLLLNNTGKYSEAFIDFKKIVLDTAITNHGDYSMKETFLEHAQVSENHFKADSSKYGSLWPKYKVALCCYIMDDYDNSLPILNSIIAQRTDLYEVFELRGKIVYKKNPESSISDFESAIKLEKSIFSYLSLAGIKYKQEKYVESVQYLTKSLRIDPENTEVYLLLARINEKVNQTQAANIYYNKVFEIDSTRYDVLIECAKMKKQKGLFEWAVTDYQMLTEKFPEEKEFYFVLSELKANLLEYDSALYYVKKVEKIDSLDFETYLIAGRILNLQKKYSEAITYLRKAFSLNYSWDILSEIAANYQNLNDYQKAIDEYNEIIKILSSAIYKDNKSLAASHLNLGLCYESIGDQEKAIKNINKAVKYQPLDVSLYVERGNYYDRRGLYTKSISDFNYAISVNSNYLDPYIFLSSVYRKNKMYDDAYKLVEKASKIFPENYLPLLEISKIHYEKQEYVKCIQYCESILSKDSTVTEAVLIMSLAELNIGNIEKAKSFIEKLPNMNFTDKLKNDLIEKLELLVSKIPESQEFIVFVKGYTTKSL